MRRADWLVTTLAELNRAIYWFHPLAWFLRRRLSELAELNCDDAVLEADGDRTQYARHLLEVANSLAASGARYRPPLSGVAMARKPNVETRIDAILDAERPLARRLSALGAIVLLVSGATAILLAAALRTSADDAPRKPAAEMEMKGPAKSESRTVLPNRPARGTARESRPTDKNATAPADKQEHVHGRVLDPDGKPVAGATVYAAWAMTRQLEPRNTRTFDEIVAKTQSDAEGNFKMSFSQDSPGPNRVTFGWHVAAFAAGFGPAWQRDIYAFKNEQANSPTTLTLVKNQPINGRFVDLEGTALKGIHVRVYALKRPERQNSIAEWITDAKKKSPPANPEDYFYPGMDARNSPYPGPFPTKWDDGFLTHGALAFPTDAVTDQDGRVHFDGLGADQLAILEIDGPLIAKCLVQVVARPMEPLPANPFESIGVVSGAYYGAQFQFVAGPSQPIVGTVTDVETGQPLADLDVHVQQFAGNLVDQGDFLATRTDDHGRYKLLGAPRGGGHRIEVDPTLERPYFPTQKRLEQASGFDPITCDFAMRRGRWITGKVTGRETRVPIKGAEVEYLPLRDNPHAKDYPNYDPIIVGHVPAGRYHTSEDGSFRVLAIPGRGILAAIGSREDEHTYLSLTKETAPKDLVQADGNVKTYHPWTITGYHALDVVEIPESNETTTHDLELNRGLSRIVKVVDSQGEPVAGVRIQGRVFPPFLEQPSKDSTIEVIGLRPNETREVVFVHPDRRIGKAVAITAGDKMNVVLDSCAVVRGRVVNDEGQPIRKLALKVTVQDRRDNWMRELPGATTGDDGRFEAVLPPGTTCRIFHFDLKPVKFGVSAEFQPKPGAVYEARRFEQRHEAQDRANGQDGHVAASLRDATCKRATRESRRDSPT